MPFINSVFLSATFGDLKKERKAAIDAFVSIGLLPFSMELFPADYRDKQEYIQNLIIEADFFALIIGGKYGDYLPDKKISFTEWEYDTASHYKKKILAFIPSDLDSIPSAKTDKNPEKKHQLEEFIKKVQAIPLTCQYDYNKITALKESISKSFTIYSYNDKKQSDYCGVWVSNIDEVVSDDNQKFPNKSDEWTFYGRDKHIYNYKKIETKG
jgi:hypothetical protein